MRHVPEIKLIRTDTTLDLSQKAEKVCFGLGRAADERGAILGPRFTGWGKTKKPEAVAPSPTKRRALTVLAFFQIQTPFCGRNGARSDTRSSRRYCNTGATLGRGGVQARQSQGRGSNKRLNHL